MTSPSWILPRGLCKETLGVISANQCPEYPVMLSVKVSLNTHTYCQVRYAGHVRGCVRRRRTGRLSWARHACMNALRRRYLQDNKSVNKWPLPFTSTSPLPPILSADQCVHRFAVPDLPISAELWKWKGLGGIISLWWLVNIRLG